MERTTLRKPLTGLRKSFALMTLLIPPVFWQAPVGGSEELPLLFDSSYIEVVNAFAENGVEMNYLSNPLLYTELYKWLGTPHVLRSRGQGGIDCSGLVKIVFRKVYGMDLKGSSQDISRMVNPIKLEELKEGDLVFFRIYHQSRIDHVGIFLGNGRFIHTSSSSGVTISEMSARYYRQRFVKAGRILPEKPVVVSVPEYQ
ncbi:MAG: C40 family peptidase [Bacteroidales bacterium]|nr:C40 family peptidase [Bacteroidales bacterium]